MGKKSSNAPAPDPRLVEAQISSMGVQDAATQQIMKLANEQGAQNAEMLPLQKEQLQFSLDSNKTAYDQSQQDRTWALGRRDALTGLQDTMVADAANFNSEATQNRRADAAQAGIGKVVSDQDAARGRTMASMGVSPSAGRFAARDGADNARAMVGAGNAARLDARNEGRALTSGAANSLAGYPAMAMQGTSGGSQIAANGLGLVNSGVGGINANYGSTAGLYGASGAAAGQMGANATNMWNAQGSFSANSGGGGGSSGLGDLGSILGAGASIYKTWASDRRLKTDIVPVGRDARTGLALYEFSYRHAPAERFRGVMADEVREVDAEAVIRAPDGFDRVDYGRLGIKFERV